MKKLKDYLSYLNESSAAEYIDRRVKIKDNSRYRIEAYADGGNGFGIIKKYYPHDDITRDNFTILWENSYMDDYSLSDFDFIDDEIIKNNDNNKIKWWRNGKLEESIMDPLSGTTDMKIKVDGDKNFVQRLIDNLSLIVKKRSTRPLRVKSITGYVNKETYARHNLYYSTYLEIELINKDFIVGEYNSVNNNITIRINDHIIYDMNSKTFDNEILIDKIVGEYKKYLKENKFIIN